MLLTRPAIIAEIAAGTIVFDPPVQDDQISVSSIDLTLDNHFRVFDYQSSAITIEEQTDYHNYTKEVVANELLVRPQETVLGVTREKVFMPANMCGWLEGRSRYARLGLLIHISAGLIQPGVQNKQVLEITNLSPNTLKLKAGERVCQLAFQRLEGEATYTGKFSTQTKP